MIEKIQFFEARKGKLKPNRVMKQVSLTDEQQEIVKEYYGKRSIQEIAFMIKVGVPKLYSNMRLMGLYKRRDTMKEKRFLLWNYTK